MMDLVVVVLPARENMPASVMLSQPLVIFNLKLNSVLIDKQTPYNDLHPLYVSPTFILRWNLFNLSYCVGFLILALTGNLKQSVVLSSTIFVFHGIFTLAINGRISSNLERNEQPTSECLLVSVNCFTLVLCAISRCSAHIAIILSAANGEAGLLLPLTLYVLFTHTFCLVMCELSSFSLHLP